MIWHTMMFIYVHVCLSPHLSSVLREYVVKSERPVVAENQLILADQPHTLLTRFEPLQLQQRTNLHKEITLKEHAQILKVYIIRTCTCAKIINLE